MARLAAKSIVVTGGAGGLGAACAQKLVDEGANVLLGDIRADEAATVAEPLGERARSIHLDVTDSSSWHDAIAAAEDTFGPVTGLVNNAGTVQTGGIEDLDEADFRHVIDINQVGVFLGMKSALPSMRRAGGGSIVNISSVGGIIAFPGIIGYTASKWAVRGMTKTAAQEFGSDGIRVNSVHPGVVTTDMTAASMHGNSIVGNQPLPREGSPNELANLVLFLLSDEASYCTASEFVADGGYTSQ